MSARYQTVFGTSEKSPKGNPDVTSGRQPALQKLPIGPLRMLSLGPKLEGVDKCHHSDIYRRQNLAYELFLEERFFLKE